MGTTYGNQEVKNCTNSGIILSDYNMVGGILGRNDNGVVENCENKGIISGDQLVGGIVGYMEIGNISNVTNKGEIFSENKKLTGCSGGIVGGMFKGDVTNAINLGKVYSENYPTGIDCAGGIIGGMMGDGNVSNVYNRGQVEAENRTGYIIGKKAGGTVSGAYYYKESGNLTGIGSDSGPVADVSGQTTLLLTPIFDTLSEFLKWIN